jgi:hypothetical protein
VSRSCADYAAYGISVSGTHLSDHDSRTQVLPSDAEQAHAPTCCAACGRRFEDGGEARAHTAHYTLELLRPDGGAGGLVLHQSKHVYLERRCTCGHCTRARPTRCAANDAWSVALSEWHLAGPTLVAFICALTQRMRPSQARVQELLADCLGLPLLSATSGRRLLGRCLWTLDKAGRTDGHRPLAVTRARQPNFRTLPRRSSHRSPWLAVPPLLSPLPPTLTRFAYPLFYGKPNPE